MRIFSFILGVVITNLLLNHPPLLANIDSPHEDHPSMTQVIKNAIPSVVSINAISDTQQIISPFDNDPFFSLFFGPSLHARRSSGSGVIVNPNGYVITCFHVIEHAKTIQVTLSNGTKFNSKAVRLIPQMDLAVLKLEMDSKAYQLPYLEITTDKMEIGDPVIAIGNAFGVGQTVTHGIISARYRVFGKRVMFQTDAPINPGNSGGPIITKNGQLAGVASAIASQTGGSHGVGFFIPAIAVQHVLKSTIENAPEASIPLKVQTADPSIIEALNMRGCHITGGCIVTEVYDANLELKPGDLIISVGGEPTFNKKLFKFFCSLVPVHQVCQLAVIPAKELSSNVISKIYNVPIRILAKKDVKQDPSNVTVQSNHALIGVVLKDLDHSECKKLNIKNGVKVVEAPRNFKLLEKGDIIMEYNNIKPLTVQNILKNSAPIFSIMIKRGNAIIQKQNFFN